MTLKYTLLTLLILLTFVLFTGCEIEELATLPTGSVFVAAFDSTGVEIIGGEIFLNGVTSNQYTPDTLQNVPIGQYTILVKAPGYYAAETDIEVIEGEFYSLEFDLNKKPPGSLEVTSSHAGAAIIVDQISTNEVTPHLFTDIESGIRELTVFLDGYKNLVPTLIPVEIDPSDTAVVTFNLQQGTLGSDEGNIAYDFTLEDDFGNMISLHNYRGQVVLLSYFFRECVNCILEFPEIEQAYQDYLPYGVQVMGINTMWYDDLEDVQFVREELGLTFKLLLDVVDGHNSTVTAQYNIFWAPINIIIDQSGEIVLRDEDGVTYEQLADKFNELLGL
ncbi:redoxin domain-containing protein [bacterium]|nr:redoxin domain-containing protein [bacterium]